MYYSNNSLSYVYSFFVNCCCCCLLFDRIAYKEYEAVAVDGRGTFPHVACFGDIAKTW